MVTDRVVIESTLLLLGALAFIALLLATMSLVGYLRRRRHRRISQIHYENEQALHIHLHVSFSTNPVDNKPQPRQVTVTTQAHMHSNGHYPTLDDTEDEETTPLQSLRRRPVDPVDDTIPEPWQLPVQNGSPDMVNISIEPSDEPTDNERMVRRLIAYLKPSSDDEADTAEVT